MSLYINLQAAGGGNGNGLEGFEMINHEDQEINGKMMPP
jgi:hypothetical protein